MTAAIAAKRDKNIMKKTIDEILGSAQKLRTPHGSIQVIPKLNPALATTLLELLAPSQRSVRQPAVDEYARAMKEGRWRWNGDSIRLDDTRHVIDGQHRLLAIVQSGVTLEHVPLVITEKVNKNAIRSIDQGRSRNLADLRSSLGLGRHEATAVSAMMAEKSDWVSLRGRYSNDERNEAYQQFTLLPEVMKLKERCTIKRGLWGAGPVSGAIRCMKKNKRIAFNFFVAVFDGTAMIDGERCEPAHKLYTYLLNKPLGRNSSMKYMREDAYKAIRAYNAYRNKEEDLVLLRYDAGNPMPEVV